MAATAEAGDCAGDGEGASGGGSRESGGAEGAESGIHLGRWLSHAPSAGFLIVLNRLLETIERTL
jgi:hypothetical protein